MSPEWTEKMLPDLNKPQLKYCNIFIDSWETTVLLELRANLKDKIWSA